MMQAIIFDMDGVLIDSEPYWQEAEMEVFAEIGVQVTAEDSAETMGLRTDEVVRHWFERSPWSGPAVSEVSERIVDYVAKAVERNGKPMPGVLRALQNARAAGLPIGLASSSPMRLIDAVCAKLEIRSAFDAVCSAANEEHGKPHPAVYLTTAAALGVLPAGCLVFEDSVPGIQAALAAGMVAVAVPPPHLYGASGYTEASFQMRSLADFDLDHLRSLFA